MSFLPLASMKWLQTDRAHCSIQMLRGQPGLAGWPQNFNFQKFMLKVLYLVGSSPGLERSCSLFFKDNVEDNLYLNKFQDAIRSKNENWFDS